MTTARTVVERVKLERLRAIAIEAAEQCGERGCRKSMNR